MPAATHGEPPSSAGSIPSSSRACVSSAVLRVRHQPVGDCRAPHAGMEALLLVDERQLGPLRLRVGLDVRPLDRELSLAELPARLDGDPLAHRHRAGAGDQSGDAGDQDVARRDARARDAHHEARVGHEAVVHAEDRRAERVPAGRSPALEARQRGHRSARRACRRRASRARGHAAPRPGELRPTRRGRPPSTAISRSRMIGRTTVSPKSPARRQRIRARWPGRVGPGSTPASRSLDSQCEAWRCSSAAMSLEEPSSARRRSVPRPEPGRSAAASSSSWWDAFQRSIVAGSTIVSLIATRA